MRDKKGMDLNGRGYEEEPGGIKGKGNVIRIYYRRTKIYFQSKGKKQTKYKKHIDTDTNTHTEKHKSRNCNI